MDFEFVNSGEFPIYMKAQPKKCLETGLTKVKGQLISGLN